MGGAGLAELARCVRLAGLATQAESPHTRPASSSKDQNNQAVYCGLAAVTLSRLGTPTSIASPSESGNSCCCDFTRS